MKSFRRILSIVFLTGFAIVISFALLGLKGSSIDISDANIFIGIYVGSSLMIVSSVTNLLIVFDDE